jgi:predicted regulator of Ras-like GTPase activity (Roadblock/LC7/MglB family)
VLQAIVQNLVGSVGGARSAIFLDGDGETIVQVGSSSVDMQILGAWQEIHLDRIKEITARLGLGNVNAVLFSQDDGNALMVPVDRDYALLLYMSSYADLQDALKKLKGSVGELLAEIS